MRPAAPRDRTAGRFAPPRAGHQQALGRGFAGLVVAVAGYLVVSAAFLGGPPGSS
jgi:hypothetical protein